MDDDYDIYGGLGEFELQEQKKVVSIYFTMCVFVLAGFVYRICQLETGRTSYQNNKIVCFTFVKGDRLNAQLQHRVEELETGYSKVVEEKEDIKKEYRVSLTNLSSLLEAARRELKRKEEQIKKTSTQCVI